MLTKRVEILLDPAEIGALHRLAKKTKKSVGALIREAVKEKYLTPSSHERIAALKMRGVIDEDGGLWHRTLDELDACAAAYAAYALASGEGSWVGDPEEGVIVLPVPELLDRYDPLPPPTPGTYDDAAAIWATYIAGMRNPPPEV